MKQEEKALAIAKNFFDKENIICFNKHFYLYNEGIWRLESDENTEAWIIIEYIKFYNEPPKSGQLKEITKYISMYSNNKYRKQIKYINEQHTNNTINVKNGILNLNTLKITSYTKEAFCFYKLPFNYVKDVNIKGFCSTMKKFLMSSMNFNQNETNKVILDDYKKTLRFIQEWMGYSLVAGNKYEHSLLMIGEGANGKSVLQDIWEYIIGKFNCSYVDLKYINDGSQIFMTRNKLVNFSKDLESNQQLDTGITKAAVSGQIVIANEKYKGQMEMNFTAKIVIACNELPYIKNPSNSVKRRFHILPFTKIFKESEQDRDLTDKLKKEADQIFTWAVNGLRNLKKRGRFDVPDRCKYSMANYIKNNDSIEMWIDEENIFKEGSEAKTKDAHDSYVKFCDDSRSKPFGKNKFYDKLESKGFKRKTLNGVRYFKNIKLPNQTIN